MLSRVADSIYWLNRYIERADNITRFIIVNKYLLMDLGIDISENRWKSIISTTGDEDLFVKKYKVSTEEKTLKFLTFDEGNPNSIISCISHARENARTIREVISSEVWNHTNELFHFIYKHKRKRSLEALDTIYRNLVKLNYMYSGLFNSTMSHDESWHFGNIGKMIERADKTSRIIDVKHFLLQSSYKNSNPYDSIEWGALLKSVSAYEMYFKTHHSIDFKNATDFLIFDKEFPRSIQYSILKCIESLVKILSFHEIKNHSVLNLYNDLKKKLENNSIDTILNTGMHSFIDVIQSKLNIIDNEIHKTFFQGNASSTIDTSSMSQHAS